MPSHNEYFWNAATCEKKFLQAIEQLFKQLLLVKSIFISRNFEKKEMIG